LLLLLAVPLQETKYLNEVGHSERIAEERSIASEVRMPDHTRCDLVSDTHAYEVEWAHKWKEAPTQAILYSIWTGKKPGVILLSKSRTQDKLHILRCKLVCQKLNIDMEVYDAVKEP